MSFIKILLLAAALSSQAYGTGTAESNDSMEELDRVDVYGTRTDLSRMRQAVIDAEDRFYEKYNDINSNDEFDVRCRVEARTGTRLTTRTCRPLYQEDAVQEGAKQAIELRQKFQSFGGEAHLGSNSPPVPAAIMIMARRQDFEQNMRDVVRAHPELLKLLETRAAAARDLEEAMSQDRNATHQKKPGRDQ